MKFIIFWVFVICDFSNNIAPLLNQFNRSLGTLFAPLLIYDALSSVKKKKILLPSLGWRSISSENSQPAMDINLALLAPEALLEFCFYFVSYSCRFPLLKSLLRMTIPTEFRCDFFKHFLKIGAWNPPTWLLVRSGHLISKPWGMLKGEICWSLRLWMWTCPVISQSCVFLSDDCACLVTESDCSCRYFYKCLPDTPYLSSIPFPF